MTSLETERPPSVVARESTMTWETLERPSDKPRTDLCRMRDWSISCRHCSSNASPCTTTDWEHTLGTCYTDPAAGDPGCVGGNGTGFPLPIPDAVRSAYQPNTLGVFTPTFIDYNWKSAYMIQYNASVQQQLPWNMALGVAYVGNHGVHLPTVRDGNPIFPTSSGPCGDPASVCVDGARCRSGIQLYRPFLRTTYQRKPQLRQQHQRGHKRIFSLQRFAGSDAKTNQPWTGIPGRLHT